MLNSNLIIRRINNFKSNKRAFWSLIIFCLLFFISLFSEIIANERPLLAKYKDNYYFPIFNFYSETTFGGDFKTEAIYKDLEVQCLIISGGKVDCWDFPKLIIEEVNNTKNY